MDTLTDLELIDTRQYPVRELAASLDDFALLADLSFQEKEQLAHQMQLYRAPAGAGIFREGDDGLFTCFVLDGKVELTKEADAGGSRRLSLVGPGKTIGEMSLIDGERRSAGARCLGEARIAVLSRSAFEKLAETHMGLAFKLMWRLAKLVSQRLRQTTGQLVDHLEG